MDSDSESQDSDEGRRFRFETTRKDAVSVPQSRRKILPHSPQRNRRTERRSRSRNRSSRDERSRYSKDDPSRKNRSSNDKDTNSKHSVKDRSSKSKKNSSRDSSSRRQHDKDSRSYRTKDSRSYDSRESRDSKDRSNSKRKSKSREKHKRRSRDKSRDRSIQVSIPEEIPKKEEKKTNSDINSIPTEMEDLKVEKKRVTKKHRSEDSKKVNHNNMDKVIESDSSNSIAVSDTVVSLASTTVNTTTSPKKLKSYFDRVVNKRSRDDSDSLYGPALPSKLEKKILNAKNTEIQIEKNIEKTELPLHSVTNDQQVIESVLSKNPISSVQKNNATEDREKKDKEIEEKSKTDEKKEEDKVVEEEEEEEEQEETFGPVLPPHMERRKVVGPVLPKNFVVSSDKMHMKVDSESNDEDDNDIVGPLPVDHPAVRDSYVQIQLEHRARQVKAKFKDKTSPEKNKREEWMVELPSAHAVVLGLGSIPRKFKTSEGPDMSDRSMWTDTPADKLRKQREKEENRFVQSEDSNKKSKKCKYQDTDVTKESVEEPKCESLLDMHLKTLKRKKKKLENEAKELGLSTRRPFDRDIDLQVNRLDDARKKKIFEKASRLNDRFTSGKI